MGRVAIVGAAGFIGSHLCRYLSGRGFDVLAIDHHPISVELGTGASLRGHFPDAAVCSALCDGRVDRVFLLAGTSHPSESLTNPLGDLTANVHDLLTFLEVIRTRGTQATLIYVSSAAVYGEASRLPLTESSPTVPVSPYGISKLAAELYARLYADLYLLRAIVVRPFSVYGPGLCKQVVWDILQKLYGQDDRELLGTGRETRDFVYISDLCAALLLVAEAGVAGRVYNICTDQETSIAVLAARLAQLSGRRRLRFSGRVRAGDPQRWRGDFTRLSALGWRPTVDLEQGLAATIKWFSETSAVPALEAGSVR
jgi:nucleoside-diphosphate-sugar epimerase